MITPAQASAIVLQHLYPSPPERVPLAQALGRVLRQPIYADRDLPPYHRATMDGIALRHTDLAACQGRLQVLGAQYAGTPRSTLPPGHCCTEIMTGAVLPAHADTVIRYEDIRLETDAQGRTFAHLLPLPVELGQNIHRQGSDKPAGAWLLGEGQRLAPAHIAAAASMGQSHLLVSKPPAALIVSTGDELVDIDQQPEYYQIRRSNSYMLQAALAQWGVEAHLQHLPDSPQALQQHLAEWLPQYPLLILSGGVSAGKADYVPAALQAAGARPLFHQVAQKPGKPLWFGTGPQGMAIFALPGNPVSSLVCCYRYILPWLQASLGMAAAPPPLAVLTDEVRFRPALTYFLQVQAQPNAQGQTVARPVPGGGSGDFANLLQVNALLELPPDKNIFEAGGVFPLIKLQ